MNASEDFIETVLKPRLTPDVLETIALLIEVTNWDFDAIETAKIYREACDIVGVEPRAGPSISATKLASFIGPVTRHSGRLKYGTVLGIHQLFAAIDFNLHFGQPKILCRLLASPVRLLRPALS